MSVSIKIHPLKYLPLIVQYKVYFLSPTGFVVSWHDFSYKACYKLNKNFEEFISRIKVKIYHWVRNWGGRVYSIFILHFSLYAYYTIPAPRNILNHSFVLCSFCIEIIYSWEIWAGRRLLLKILTQNTRFWKAGNIEIKILGCWS